MPPKKATKKQPRRSKYLKKAWEYAKKMEQTGMSGMDLSDEEDDIVYLQDDEPILDNETINTTPTDDDLSPPELKRQTAASTDEMSKLLDRISGYESQLNEYKTLAEQQREYIEQQKQLRAKQEEDERIRREAEKLANNMIVSNKRSSQRRKIQAHADEALLSLMMNN